MDVLTPPLIRKKTQALHAKLKPKAREMYRRVPVLGAWDKLPSVPPAVPAEAALATCVALKAKKRNRKVPANSPAMAMK